MGWGFLDPTRLLQKTWDSASELAMEMYSMASEGSAAKVERPVEIAKQPGQPALKISPAPAVAQPKQPIQPTQDAPAGSRNTHTQRPVESAGPGLPAPVSTQAFRSMRAAQIVGGELSSAIAKTAEQEEKKVFEKATSGPVSWIASRMIGSALDGLRPQEQASPTQPGLAKPRASVASVESISSRAGTQPQASPEPSSPIDKPEVSDRSQESTAYSPKEPSYGYRDISRPLPVHPDPVADISGPVVFRGVDPVQFDVPPQVYDKRTGQYVSYPPSPMLGSPWIPWLTINAKICYCDSTGVSAATLRQPPSSSTLGTGIVRMYEVDQETPTLVEIDDDEGAGTERNIRVYSIYNFPFQQCFAMATMLGDSWFVFPFGSCVPAKTRAGGIGAGGAATCDLYSTLGGTKVAIGSATVYNDMAKTVGSAGNVILETVVDMSGQLRVVAEACP